MTAARTAPAAADRAALADIIFRRSFGRGKIRLASGRESDFYFDLKPSMLDPQGAALMARALLAEVLGATADYVGGLEMGAVPITGAVCQHSFEQNTPVRGFFVRKKAKDHGARKLVEGLRPDESLKGKRVVVVEDVTTSGDSALQAVDACREAGAEIVLAISIVDREEGAAEAFAAQGVAFKALFQASEFLSRTD
jgi:orotate phosphoribosyltransferase